jgi:hypothetical protein
MESFLIDPISLNPASTVYRPPSDRQVKLLVKECLKIPHNRRVPLLVTNLLRHPQLAADAVVRLKREDPSPISLWWLRCR